MTTLSTIIIALLMSLGIINSSSDLDNLTHEQQHEIHQIIIDDDLGS